MDPFSLVLLLLLVPLVLISIRGSKQRKAVAQMQTQLAPGAEVMTASGQFGRVTDVRDDRVEIEVAAGVRTWWLRQAVARTVDAPAPAADGALDGSTADGPAATGPADLRDADPRDDDPRYDDDPRDDDPTDGPRRPA